LNIDPDGRVQVTCTGATPPAVVGDAKVTTAGLLAAATVKLVGQVIDSGVGGGSCGAGCRAVGPVGDEQAGVSVTSAERNASAHRQRCARRRLATLPCIK
jgi:hypothetical protein